jgi:hypothetical protein
VRQVQPQIELQLVIVRFHVRAQGVEGLVVFGFLQVREFVHHDHLQELRRGVAEHGGDADLAAGLQPAAVHARDGGVGPQCVLHHLQRAVVRHLAQR